VSKPATGRAIVRDVREVLPWPEGWAHLTPEEVFEPWDERRPKKRRPRKPGIRRMIAAAEKAGKSVSSITLPDGTVLQFGESEPTEAANPWLAKLRAVKS
jgi:hypothetical protein